MWTAEGRGDHERKGWRDPSDPTDGERAPAAPLIPPAKRGGRPGGRAPGARRPGIVKRSEQAQGLVAPPERRIVEGTVARLGRRRRLAKDVATLTRTDRARLPAAREPPAPAAPARNSLSHIMSLPDGH